MESFVRQLVWLDFRLAVLFAVFIPLVLLVWAFRVRATAIKRSLVIYWRVASLLVITVYLAIGSLPISFLAGTIATILIPLSLWYWQDINEDIGATRGKIGAYYEVWRWAITAYMTLATLFNFMFANCAFSTAEQFSTTCKLWLEPPLLFKAIFHANVPPEQLSFFGVVSLLVYGLYLASFAVFSLPKQGRIAFRE